MQNNSPRNLLRTDKYNYLFDPHEQNSLSIIASHIAPGSRVLEFGPAHGRLTRHLQQNLGCRVCIVEIDPVAAREASRYAVETLVGDIMEFEWLEKFGPERFDVILFADVLEHLQNPWEVLNRASGLLKDDGWVWISLPNVAHNAILIDLFNNRFRYREEGLLDATHIRFFTGESLEEMVQSSGLHPVYRLTTFCPVPQTELGNLYEHVPPALGNELKLRPGGEIYQHVFGCVKTAYRESAGLQDYDERTLLPGFTAQLYIDTGVGFSEANILERSMSYGNAIVEFDLSGQEGICGLRFDPCNRKAIIRLTDVRVVSEGGGTSIEEERISSNCTSRSGRLFVFDHDDPQFLISLEPGGEPLSKITFYASYVFVGPELPYLDADIANAKSIHCGWPRSRTIKENHLSAPGSLVETEGDGPSSNSWLYDLIRQKNLALQKCRNELTHKKNRLQDLERTYGQLLDRLGDRESRLRENHEELMRLRAVNADILSSSSWKMGEPLRRLVTGVNKLIGLVGHRSDSGETGSIDAIAPALEGPLTEEDQLLIHLWRGYLQDVQAVIPFLLERIACRVKSPLISLIIQFPSARSLDSTFGHVLEQIYPFWELHAILPAGVEMIRTDSPDTRIHYHAIADSESIQNALPKVLNSVEGAYVLFMDQGTCLPPHALFHLAETMEKHKPGMIYTDGVVMEPGGGSALRFVFRPAFSPEWLRSHPYIDHLLALRTDLARDLGTSVSRRSRLCLPELSQLVGERGEVVAHIAEPLYVWTPNKQEEAPPRGCACRECHSPEARKPELANQAGLKVAILIPSKDRGELLQQCVESIERTVSSVDYGIFVINHDSTDPIALEYLQRMERRHSVLSYSGPFNFSLINNQAVGKIPSAFTHILFCNNDIEAIRPGWLEHLLSCCQRPGVGAVGPLLLFTDGQTVQHGGVCLGMMGAAEHYGKFLSASSAAPPLNVLTVCHEVSAVTAACMLVTRKIFEEVGGYDENLAVGFGDIDLCLRIGQLGMTILYCPEAVLIHHESASRDRGEMDPHPEDTALFRQKWHGLLQEGDPYFNPHYDLFDHHWRPCNPLRYTGSIVIRLSTGKGVIRTLRQEPIF